MAKINVIKKSKDLIEEIDKMDTQFSSLSRNAAQLEKELTKKKLAFAQRDEAERARTAEALAEEQGKTETKTDVAEQMTEAVTEQKENKAPADVAQMPQSTATEPEKKEQEKKVAEPESKKAEPEKKDAPREKNDIQASQNRTAPKKDGFAQGARPERTDRQPRAERTDRPERSDKQNRAPNGARDGANNKFAQKNDFYKQQGNQQRMAKDKDDDDSESQHRRAPSHKSDKNAKVKESISAMLPNKASETRNFGQKIKDKSKKTREEYWDDGKPSSTKNYHNNQKQNEQNKHQNTYVAPERKKAIVIDNSITVKDFSEAVGISVAEIVKKLMSYGIFATINNEIDFDTAELVAEEFGITVTKSMAKSAEDKFDDLIKEDDDDESKKVKRPPIVTVMGHVDHGKTSLLDAIRNSNVTDKEAGGITQHIGAYTVNHKGNKITFLDTPGHEAFTTMRSRGAKVTDVAVIVVAANDGVMPQTIEAINHAKAADTPIIIALNKMDVHGANPENVKKQLAEHDVLVEDWGGDVACIPVSAKTKEGIEDLLEMIILVTDMLELKANPDTKARGTIIEARLDKSKGPVATILVQNGTLREGETVVAGMTFGNVRAMFDHNGKRIKKAGPSIPVEITGLNDVPQAGDMIFAIADSKLSRNIVEERINKYREMTINASKPVSLDDLFDQIKQGDVKTLNLIIKADVQGSVEAVKQSLEKLSNDEVKVVCIHSAVGAITEADVSLAKASNAIIIGFNVRAIGNVDEIAQNNGIDIRNYSIIYNAIDDVSAAMKGMLAPVYKEVVHGRAEVRMTFKVSGVGTVAGSYVIKGKVNRHDKVRIIRDGIVVFEGEMESLKRFKDDVKEVAEGFECGIGIKNFNDIKEMDIIEAYAMEEVERK